LQICHGDDIKHSVDAALLSRPPTGGTFRVMKGQERTYSSLMKPVRMLKLLNVTMISTKVDV
jgi:hypothetical protein